MKNVTEIIKAVGITVQATTRPRGSWKWQNRFSYAVYCPHRSFALPGSVQGDIAAKKGTRTAPARGWDTIDQWQQENAWDWAREMVAGVIAGELTPADIGSRDLHAAILQAAK